MAESFIKRLIKPTECYKKVMGKYESPEFEELTITSWAYLKLLFIINLVGNHEVSGFGKVQNGKIVDWYIPEQELGTLTANIDEEAMLEMMKDIPAKEMGIYKVDFHSHNNAGCTPSSTDKESYKLQAQNRGYKQFIAMIINKSESIWCKCVRQGEVFSDVKVTIEPYNLEEETAKELFDECKELVATRCYERHTIVTKKKEPEVKQKELFSKSTCLCCGEPLETYKEKQNGYCNICLKNYGLEDYTYHQSQWWDRY